LNQFHTWFAKSAKRNMYLIEQKTNGKTVDYLLVKQLPSWYSSSASRKRLQVGWLAIAPRMSSKLGRAILSIPLFLARSMWALITTDAESLSSGYRVTIKMRSMTCITIYLKLGIWHTLILFPKEFRLVLKKMRFMCFSPHFALLNGITGAFGFWQTAVHSTH